MSVMSRTRNRWLPLKNTISRLRFDGGAGTKCGAVCLAGHCWRAADAFDFDGGGAAVPCEGPQVTATTAITARLRTKPARNIVHKGERAAGRSVTASRLARLPSPHADAHVGPSRCSIERLAPVPGLLAPLARAAWSIRLCRRAQVPA